MAGSKFWTNELVLKTIQDVMKTLNIEHLPTMMQLKDVGGLHDKQIRKLGGLRSISTMTGIPMSPKPKTYDRSENVTGQVVEKWNGRPSRATEIEAKARKQGLSYADLQKAETLRLAGRISV